MVFEQLLNLVSSDKAPDICIDSRLVKPGNIFVAIKGTACDGHNFISQALVKGAKYIVCQHERRRTMDEGRVTSHESRATSYEVIFVDDTAETAAILVQAKKGNPAAKLINLAVTGTNGKTTVVFLVRSIIQKAGEKCGLIGTIIYDTGSEVAAANLTTPDCLTIAQAQAQMVQAGAKYMVIEASSHALSQNRLAAIDFKAAAFTNLTGDHLDYHKTKENYLAAKAKLFMSLSPDATAVLNRQSPEAQQIARQIRQRGTKIFWYAVDEPADISAHIESMDMNGTVFVLDCALANSNSIRHRRKNSKLVVKTQLLGRHNVSNCLAAAGLCLAAGLDLETIAAGLSALQSIPGRLEKVHCPGHESPVTSHVFVDYAHTDDALKNVLSTLKPLCKGKLIVVFGCGGDRDRTKRPRMAKVAEQLADFVIVTSDNPRTERPEDIIEEIVAGFEKGPCIRSSQLRDTRYPRFRGDRLAPAKAGVRATKIIEPDRRKAIELAIKSACKGDIVLIAGKGHENYQIIGTQKFDFSDKTVALEYLKTRD